MKIKHLIAILFFVVLIIAGVLYANSKNRASNVALEDTDPEIVIKKYYKKLSTRDGGSVDEVLMPPKKYKTWVLYDRLNSSKARITAKMFVNLKNIRVRSIQKSDYVSEMISFPKINNKIKIFSPEDTCVFNVKYDIEYFKTNDKYAMYSEFYNKTYEDTNNRIQKNQTEKV